MNGYLIFRSLIQTPLLLPRRHFQPLVVPASLFAPYVQGGCTGIQSKDNPTDCLYLSFIYYLSVGTFFKFQYFDSNPFFKGLLCVFLKYKKYKSSVYFSLQKGKNYSVHLQFKKNDFQNLRNIGSVQGISNGVDVQKSTVFFYQVIKNKF